MKVQINDSIKKFDAGHMVTRISLSIGFVILGIAVAVGGVILFWETPIFVIFMGVGLVMGLLLPIGTIPSRYAKMAKKTLEKAVEENNIQSLYTFDTRGKMMIIDAENKKIVMSYRSNPKEVSIISMERVTDLRVNNWAMAGMTRCISADFRIDGKKERIMTFAANHNCLLSDPSVIEGLDKANTILEIIEGAKDPQTVQDDLDAVEDTVTGDFMRKF